MTDRLRVALHPADSGACGLNRLVWPAEALADDPNLDISIGSRLQAVRENGVFGDRAIGVRTNADVIVLQRPLRRELVEVIPVIQRSGVAVCVEVDDDFHSLPKGHPGRRAWAPMSDPNRNWRWLAEACRLADLVTTTTPALAARYAPHGRCVVLPNCVPDWYLDVEGDRSEQPTLTWTGTPITHTGDLEMLGDSVKRAVDATGAQFLAIGSTSTLDILDVPGEVVEWSPLTDRGPKGYPRQVARADVGIVPLVDSQFTRAKCLDRSTRVATRRGVLPIGEVEVYDHVWHHGWVRVLATNAELATVGREIQTESGRRLKLTDDHRMMVNGAWQFASTIQPGDQIALAPDEIGATEPVRVPWPSDGRASRGAHDRQAFVSAPDVPHVTITERWGRVLGVFAGDGSVSTTAVTFSCDGQDQDFIDLLSADLEAMGLWPATEHVRTFDGKVLRRRSVTASSTHLLRFMRSLGLVDPVRSRRIVCVPEVIWRSPREVVAAFLAGLFEADGTTGKCSVSLTTIHHQFALDIQRLLSAFGMESFISRRWNTAEAGGKKFGSWIVRLRKEASLIFEKEIGFLSERKRARLAEVSTRVPSNALKPQTWTDTVTAIEPTWLEPVDIEVEGGMFAAAGFLSHNSALKMMEYAALGVVPVVSGSPDNLRMARAGVGLVADGQWFGLLRSVLSRPDLRAEIAAEGRDAMRAWTYERNAHRWAEAWVLAFANRRAAVAA